MRIAVLGATGATGCQLVQQALDRGHSVKAVVRTPEKFKITHEQLEVIKGDIYSADSLAAALEGCEAVLSCLGHHGFGPFTTCTIYSESAKQVVAAMRQNNIKLFIAVTSWCTKSEKGNPKLMEWLTKPLLIGKLLADMDKMEKYLCEECQDISFVAVRPPTLDNSPITDKRIQSAEQQFLADVSSYMSRADVARFMLDCLEQGAEKTICLAVGIKK